MIELDCKDSFLKKNLTNLLYRKKLISPTDNQNYFSTIHIKNCSNSIELIINGNSFDINLPIDINIFQKKIYEKLFEINVDFSNGNYYPYQRLIKNKDYKKTYLSYLQNIILSNLILKDEGIEKFALYKLIWPEDRNISLNKLDTHLTNLKTYINSNLNIKINFHSQNKILKLIID
tara:strand:+ start:1579 stop:2106 length:528 start_codon:yes stop_codon:yes gene_type:complete